MTYNRLQGELRQEFLAEMESRGIERTANEHNGVKILALDIAREDQKDLQQSERYAEGFARGLTGSRLMHEQGEGGYTRRNIETGYAEDTYLRDLELGYANGFVTKRILSGRVPVMTRAGLPR